MLDVDFGGNPQSISEVFLIWESIRLDLPRDDNEEVQTIPPVSKISELVQDEAHS